MGKFKNTLVKGIKEEQEQKQKQAKLRSKHHIEADNVMVVEKANLLKFLVRTLGKMIQVVATVIIFSLAVIGLLALVYPEVREEILQVLQRIINELIHYIK